MNQFALLQLFSPPADPALLTYGSHNPTLVLLSLAVAIFSSWMGLQLASQAQTASTRMLRYAALLSGSVALGSGVWAMHFIGMLAFNLCTRVDYAPGITVLSVLPSLAASYIALHIISRPSVRPRALAVGGVLVGAGIGAMHYTGMEAMRMSLVLRYDLEIFALSIVVAVALATLALWVRSGLLQRFSSLNDKQRTLLAALVMGCAITGMHYTGMAAARFVGVIPPGNAPGASSAFLALATTLITVALTAIVVAVNGWLRYRAVFEQLSESESWMRALLTTTVDGVITIDAHGIVEEYNVSAERIFGWTRAEIIGRNVDLLMGDREVSIENGLREYMHNVRSGAVRTGREVVAVRKDGSAVPVRVSIGNAAVAKRDLYVLFVTDISERRAMTQALRDSEQHFRSLIGNIPGTSYRYSLQGERYMAFLSDYIERVTGYHPDDFLGRKPLRRLEDMILAEDLPLVSAAIMRAIVEHVPYQCEYRLRHADDSVRWMWANGTIVRNAAGQPEWLDGVVFDITERREDEEALREAKDKAERAAAARASFVANMSHEIRTPMNAILGFTDVLLDSPLAPDQRRHLDTVRGAGRSLLRLLNEILDTAKLDKGAMELDPADYNLLALIDELSSTLGAKARVKGLAIDIAYDPALPSALHGDELRMRQILTNLLDNAIKFTSVGTVSLLAHADAGQLHLLVKDSGIGIAADRLDAIFEPFTQADASMTRRFGGTGLGTTICRQLVDLMGGRIWAESTPGQGSTFHVLLPLVPAHDTVAQSGERVDFPLPPLRILAADDVAQNLELLELLLAKRGHSLLRAGDGAEAVRLAASHHDIDLILMDVQMPIMDGLAATLAIRTAEQHSGRTRVPVVAMTASVLDAHRQASAAAGMDGFATKPVDWYALSHEMARVLGLAVAPQTQPLTGASGQRVLNRKAGLQRWDGNEHSYLQALLRFVRDYQGAAQPLAALLAEGGHAEVLGLAHKMRGVAANLGLEQLALVLGRLEALCGDTASAHEAGLATQHSAAIGQAMGELVAQLQAAIAAIRALPAAAAAAQAEAQAAPAAAATTYDAAGAQRAATALIHSLQRGALDDADLVLLSSSLGGHPSAARLAQIDQALADFDFPLAEDILNNLLRQLEGSPT